MLHFLFLANFHRRDAEFTEFSKGFLSVLCVLRSEMTALAQFEPIHIIQRE